MFSFSAALCSSCSKLLLYSSCSTCCFAFLLFKTIALLFLLDVVLCFSCSTYYTTPFIWCGVMLLLLDLVFYSSSLTYCFAFLAWCGALLLLFDLLFHSSCLTCYSIPLVRPTTLHSTWFSTPLLQLVALLFLFDLLFRSFCSTCCSVFLVQPIVLFLLLNLLLRSSCLTFSLGTFLLHSWFPFFFCSMLLFLFFLFHISISPHLPFYKHGVWRSCLNLNSSG